MRQAALELGLEALPMDVFLTGPLVEGTLLSASLNIQPIGEDAVIQGGRLEVHLDRECVAVVSLRRSAGYFLHRDGGCRIGICSRVRPEMASGGGPVSVWGDVIYSHPNSRELFRCLLRPEGAIRVERVSALRVKLLRWLRGWQEFMTAPLE